MRNKIFAARRNALGIDIMVLDLLGRVATGFRYRPCAIIEVMTTELPSFSKTTGKLPARATKA
jgi:hypothetical protein